MNIEDLQLIVETIYQHNPSAYKRGGDVELLNSHIKAMQHLKEVNKIHYKKQEEYKNQNNFDDLYVLRKKKQQFLYSQVLLSSHYGYNFLS